MHNKHDQFAKRVLTEVFDQLDEHGEVDHEKNVSPLDAQRMDLWYQASPDRVAPSEAELPSFLRLPLRMGRRAAHFEFESGIPDSVAVRRIVRKQLTWDEHRRQDAERHDQPQPPLFPTWVLLPGKPRDYFERRRVRPAEGWPLGFYETDLESELWFVVTTELPRTRETLLLRLLGSERCRKEAIEDLRQIPEADVEFPMLLDVMAELRRAVECDREIPEPERTFFMTEARAEHIRYTEQVRGEGRSEGLREGESNGVYAVCQALNIEVTASRRAQIEKMDLDELRLLREQLLQRRDWPLN